jgi:hypothetical protein
MRVMEDKDLAETVRFHIRPLHHLRTPSEPTSAGETPPDVGSSFCEDRCDPAVICGPTGRSGCQSYRQPQDEHYLAVSSGSRAICSVIFFTN